MKKKSVRPTTLFLTLAAAAGLIPNAYADWNVAVGNASTNGAWSGGSPDVWTPSATGATVSAAEIGARLGAGTPVTIRTSGGGGAETGDINVNTAVTWTANKLTLSAWRNIAVKAGLNASASAQLALEYGQSAVNAGNSSDYYLSNGATVILPAGANFSTKLGSDVGATTWTVITSLGVEGDATVAPGTMTLQGMNTGLAGNYALGADIAAGITSGWNSGAGFTAVGTSAAKFTGSFDGLGHTITGLTINRPANIAANNYQGLFGYTAGALRNVGLLNSSIAGANAVGTLAGRSDGKVGYVYADGGGATASIHQAGGLLGGLGGSIENSYANVSVTGTNNACCGGGVQSSAIGGLAGLAAAGSSISNSYATGAVSGGTYVGGLVGQNRADITSSFASGAVGALTVNRGGFIGDQWAGAITDSYWDSVTTGQGSIGRIVGGAVTSLTDVAAAPKAQASYPGLDFAGSWRIYEGNTRPLLKSFLRPLTVTANNATKVYDGLAYSGGNGATYSTAPDANLLGTVSYGGTSQGAVNIGSYAITPYGLYSNQRGYDIAFVDGVLTVARTLPVTPPVIQTVSPQPAIVSESGTSTTFQVVLNNGAPAATVTIPLTIDRPDKLAASVNSIVFAPGQTTQTITLTGVDNAILDGDQPAVVTLGSAVSADSNYSRRVPLSSSFQVIVRDNDVALPALPLAGGTSTGYVDLTNSGSTPISSVSAKVYDALGNVIGSGTLVQNLPAKGTVSIDMQTVQSTLGVSGPNAGGDVRIELFPFGGELLAQARIKSGNDTYNASAAMRGASPGLQSSAGTDMFELRITNLSAQTQDGYATLYGSNGQVLGAANKLLFAGLPPKGVIAFNAGSLQNTLGVAPWPNRAWLKMSDPNTFALQAFNTSAVVRAMTSVKNIGVSQSMNYLLPATDSNVVSMVRIYNDEAYPTQFDGVLYGPDGTQLATIPLGTAAAYGVLLVTNTQLQATPGMPAWTGPARLKINSDAANFEAQGSLRSNGKLTDTSSVITDGIVAHLPDASEALDLTLNIVNPGTQAVTVTGTLTNSSGQTIGSANFAVGTLNPNASVTLTRANLVALAGSWSGRATLTLNSSGTYVEVLALLTNSATGAITNLSERPLR